MPARSVADMKALLEIIGSSIAFAAFAAALLYGASAKAEPLRHSFHAIFRPTPAPLDTAHARRHRVVATFRGGRTMIASYYGGGRRERLNPVTACGVRFRARALTAAHRTLPCGTLLSVCYRACATVLVNDRGPAAWTGRSLDLSHGAARAIGMIGVGVARVRVAIIGG